MENEKKSLFKDNININQNIEEESNNNGENLKQSSPTFRKLDFESQNEDNKNILFKGSSNITFGINSTQDKKGKENEEGNENQINNQNSEFTLEILNNENYVQNEILSEEKLKEKINKEQSQIIDNDEKKMKMKKII